MTPLVPEANPPCQSIVETFGFHSPQVDMSDQTLQTFSGEAVVSTEVPYSRAIECPPSGRLGGGEPLPRHVHDVTGLQEVERHDAGHQNHRANQFDRA